jgi:glycosyltransferase involved in cell wall biosynthesis
MRVLVTSSTFPVRLDDGLPRFVYDLATALSDHCALSVLVPDVPGAAPSERMGPVEVRRFQYFVPRRWQRLAYGHGMRSNMRASRIARLQPLPYLASQVAAIRAVVGERRIDVVNSHWLIPQGLSAALARGRARRFGHVLSVHAADVYLLRRLPFGRSLARFVLGRTDRILADGTQVREALDDLVGRRTEAVIQPMGVWRERFQGDRVPLPAFPRGYLVFCGRLTEKKGVTYLLQALPRIRERHPGLGLVVVGYGDQEGALRQEAARLGLAEAVVFLGARSHDEIGRYLRGSRVAVVPSVVDRHGETDGMPTVVVEAMASGTRVVATAVDGIPDVVRDGVNGWLCREKDPEDLADAILTALQDPPGSPVVSAADRTAEGLDWTRIARAYLRAFEEALGEAVIASPSAS